MQQKQLEKDTQETLSIQEKSENSATPSKKHKARKLKKSVLLVLFLLLVGSASYVLTPLFLPYLADTPEINQDEIISVPAQNESLNDIGEVLLETNETPTDTENSQEQMHPVIEEQNNEPTVMQSEEVAIIKPALPEPVIPKLNDNAQTLDKVTPPVKESTQTVQTPPLLKVIQLYESLQQGTDCRPLLEELMSLASITPTAEQSLKELLPICLEHPLPQQIQQAFYKNKRRTILRILQNENSALASYLQMILYTIFDIRKVNPSSDTPMDLLYSIQNAVDQNQFELVLKLIDQLPENVQPALFDLQQCALREASIYQTLQNLIQTLASEGGIYE